MVAAAREDSLRYFDSEHGIAISGNIVISLSMQPPNAGYLAAWTQAMDQLVSDVPGPICVLNVIDAGARAPDEAAKAAIRRTVQRHAARVGAVVYVVEGRGFAAAAMRSALSLLSLVARYPFPQKVFPTVASSGAWITETMGATAANGPTPSTLLAIVDRLHAQVASATPARSDGNDRRPMP
ncbi:MAG: hypothetical protein RL685_6613 [Pseudomonadota bacterium]|jgi:hypothetical protein